jgi:hypothetical protein
MQPALSFLKGKKTYLCAIAGAIYGALIATGQAENEAWVWGVIGAGSVAALRQGVSQAAAGSKAILCAAVLAGFTTGCATFTTDQKDISYEAITNGTRVASVPIREIRTRSTARAFWDAKSALASFKASQTDKTQGMTLGGLAMESSGTNAVQVLKEIKEIVQSLPK